MGVFILGVSLKVSFGIELGEAIGAGVDHGAVHGLHMAAQVPSKQGLDRSKQMLQPCKLSQNP